MEEKDRGIKGKGYGVGGRDGRGGERMTRVSQLFAAPTVTRVCILILVGVTCKREERLEGNDGQSILS